MAAIKIKKLESEEKMKELQKKSETTKGRQYLAEWFSKNFKTKSKYKIFLADDKKVVVFIVDNYTYILER